MTGLAVYKGIFSLALSAIPFGLASVGLLILSVLLVKKFRRRYAISIDHEKLDYYEFSPSSGAQKHNNTVRIEDISSVVYDFCPEGGSANVLRIMTYKNIAHEESIADDDPVEKAWKSFNPRKQPLRFVMEGITPVDAIAIEHWLQRKLNERKIGEKVL